ncbi:multiheme c-type cytochrome [Pelobacter propionicus]|uniref:Cytochrome c domain-containing protein n=1 Tax=Pelobacter propionicus (strain DSM 2379 / NBRC 103807 / OttBd1) TaxID=338966 RepID=A1AUS0_PELPD|nr:multiheme c-type cytochrome [Pelobacter propionicus]ABL01091.1 hypothetical protein Ppro_3498 [Pelobacter propionicus DSM 2379]
MKAAIRSTLLFSLSLTCMPLVLQAADNGKEFVGSEKCRSCHIQEYNSWKESYHAKIVRPRKAGMLKEAFEKWTSDGTGPGPTKGNITGKAHTLDDVQYVVGSRWKQRYLVKNEQTGNLQFMDKQFNRLSGMWENYGQKNDWDTQCATCHTTGYRITSYDEKAKRTTGSTFSERGIGCEACHGPGAKHVKAKGIQRKRTIFNPANVDSQAQSKVCGYCHVRVENETWHTAQGNPREDMPAPKRGDSYRAGEDWTTWTGIIMPGLQAENPFTKEYTGDLKGLFKTDEHARANGIYEEAKHHQQYQGFIQSQHFKSGSLSCITCHSPHAGKGKLKKVARNSCGTCHAPSYTVEKYMPNTGQTAGGLFVRSHTFGKNPRTGGAGAADLKEPNYYE